MSNPDKRRKRPDIEAIVDREMQRLGPARDAIVAELARLIDRLLAIPGSGDAIMTVADHLIEPGWWIDPDDTGVIEVWLVIGECTYWLTGSGELRVQREFAGRIESARVHGDGRLGRWRVASGPPRNRAASN